MFTLNQIYFCLYSTEIGPLLGRDIQIGLEGSVNPALDSATVMAQGKERIS